MTYGNVVIFDEKAKEKAKNEAEYFNDCIIVANKTDNSMMNILRGAAGIITEEKEENSHAEIVGLSLGIPVITGAKNACSILKSGTRVKLDAKTGTVCSNEK